MVPCVVKQDASAPECDWSQAKPENYLRRLFAPENAPNIALFLVGFAGVVVALLTLRKLERQTKATEDAAEAALCNTQAMVHSQRPWIIVQIEEVPRDNAAKTCFRLSGYNHGSTPAFVIAYKGPIVVWLANPDNELPPSPDYGTSDCDASLVLPRHKFSLGEIDPWGERKVTSVELQLVVYGLIEYRDGVTDTIHKTAFCYRRKREKMSDMGGHLVLCGPAAYNECT
jgi:hypothetical protein